MPRPAIKKAKAPAEPTTAQTPRYWMIQVQGKDVPRVRHDTYAAAEAEAERLAKALPGAEVAILESITFLKVSLNPVAYLPPGPVRERREDDHDIPF